MKILVLTIIALTSLLMIPQNSKNAKATILYDFNPDCDTQKWTVVNDVVMGGVSKSKLEVDADGNGVFSGTVSTENNGGFASIRYAAGLVEIGNATQVKLRIKGDGKSYQFRIKHRSEEYFSYITTFETSGDWETVSIPLNTLYPSFRGQKLDKANFSESSLEQLSFLIANKRNEQFRLEIDRIELS